MLALLEEIGQVEGVGGRENIYLLGEGRRENVLWQGGGRLKQVILQEDSAQHRNIYIILETIYVLPLARFGWGGDSVSIPGL